MRFVRCCASQVNALGVVWPFYIMSRAYLTWRPLGFWKAVGTTTLIHAAINALAIGIAGIALAFKRRPLASGDAHNA